MSISKNDQKLKDLFIEKAMSKSVVYGGEICKGFADYWTATNPHQKKMRWQNVNGFNLEERLKEQYENNKKKPDYLQVPYNTKSDSEHLSNIHRKLAEAKEYRDMMSLRVEHRPVKYRMKAFYNDIISMTDSMASTETNYTPRDRRVLKNFFEYHVMMSDNGLMRFEAEGYFSRGFREVLQDYEIQEIA